MSSPVRFGWFAALVVVTLLAPPPAHAQQGIIVGMVRDARGGVPLGGVQVHIPALRLGTLSDNTGRYTLTGVPAGQHELRAELIGYGTHRQTVTVAAGATLTINISLETSAIGLDEIVVTGTPGAQLRRSLGNVVGRVEASELQKTAPAATFEQMLLSTQPGLNVHLGSNAKPSAGANIRIRGIGSMALSSQPLLYIDGVRVNNDFQSTGPGSNGHFTPSRWQDIAPEEIQSVEVIKGPAAATLYGTEASNGVVNIITKKGAAGAPQFSVQIAQGANWLTDPETGWNPTYYRCRGISSKCVKGEVVEFNVLREDRIRNGAEWFRTGLPRTFGGNLQGGSDRLRYFTSVDFDRAEGITGSEWRNRLNGRANLNWTPSERVDVQFGLGSIKSKARVDSNSGIIGIQWACTSPGCEEGSGANAVDGRMRGYFAYMPQMFLEHNFQYEEVSRTNYNLTITHRPTTWLTHRLVTGADWTFDQSSRREDAGLLFGIDFLNGRKLVADATTDYISLDYSATATVTPAPDMSFATSGGVQYNSKTFHTITASGERFPVPSLETISAGAQLLAGETFLQNKTIGAYLQEQVSWRNRVFLTGAVRGDDNSAFGENFDFVLYPKVSASWVVSEEPFLGGLVGAGVNQLRLRGAWGRAGQQPDFFAAIRTYTPVAGATGTVGLTPNNIGNPDVKPEVGEELEIGLDAGLWNDRLNIELTYYSTARKDALFSVPSPQSLGFPGSQFKNLGEVTNKGLELGLKGANLYSNGGVGLDVSLTFATNHNKITSMGGLPPQIFRGGFIHSGWTRQLFVEGFPLGAMFMKRVVSADIQGVDAAAKVVNVMCEGGSVLPSSTSDYPLSRGGGAAVPCANAPNIYMGAPTPTRTAALSTTLRLGSSLSVFAELDYSGGNWMIDGPVSGQHLFYRNSRAIVERKDPILLGYETLGAAGMNQAGLFDASMLRLRRVSASYTIPNGFAQRVRAKTMSLTVSAMNPWLIWVAQPEVFGARIIEPEATYTRVYETDPGGLTSTFQNQTPAMNSVMATLRVAF